MVRIFAAVLAVLAWLTTSPAHAQWKGEAGLGVVRASGNTESDSLSGSVALSRESGRLRHNLAAELYQASTEGVDTADRKALGS